MVSAGIRTTLALYLLHDKPVGYFRPVKKCTHTHTVTQRVAHLMQWQQEVHGRELERIPFLRCHTDTASVGVWEQIKSLQYIVRRVSVLPPLFLPA